MDPIIRVGLAAYRRIATVRFANEKEEVLNEKLWSNWIEVDQPGTVDFVTWNLRFTIMVQCELFERDVAHEYSRYGEFGFYANCFDPVSCPFASCRQMFGRKECSFVSDVRLTGHGRSTSLSSDGCEQRRQFWSQTVFEITIAKAISEELAIVRTRSPNE